MSERPRLVIIGGPNGAGKTTFALTAAAEWHLPYLGADRVAEEHGLGSTGGDAVQAGRLFLARIDETLTRGESVLVESTLSGLGMTRLIDRAQKVGYVVTVGLVFVDSAELCVERVRLRVRKGGHFVPDDDVRRRFSRSLRNFWDRYRLEADRWQLAYNGGQSLVRVAFGCRARGVVM